MSARWAGFTETAPVALSDEDLIYLDGFAHGLRETRKELSPGEAAEVGCMMLRLLGHVAHLERDGR